MSQLELPDSFEFPVDEDTVIYSRSALQVYYELDLEKNSSCKLSSIQHAHKLLYAEIGNLIGIPC